MTLYNTSNEKKKQEKVIKKKKEERIYTERQLRKALYKSRYRYRDFHLPQREKCKVGELFA